MFGGDIIHVNEQCHCGVCGIGFLRALLALSDLPSIPRWDVAAACHGINEHVLEAVHRFFNW